MKLIELIKTNKKVVVVIAIIAIVLYGVFAGGKKSVKQDQKVSGKGSITTEESLKGEIEALKKSIEEIKKAPVKNAGEDKTGTPSEQKGSRTAPRSESNKSLKDLEKAITSGGFQGPSEKPQTQRGGAIPQGAATPIEPQKKETPILLKIDIPETKQEPKNVSGKVERDDLNLPMGSFAEFTLVSGAYATESGERMPVTGVITKAFVGPNKSAVPLRGCTFLGKAQGNIGYKSADIKAVRLACVWPDGRVFEADISGYVTDQNGDFGLKGNVNRHTGTFFSTVGITSFIEGLAKGLSRAQEVQDAVASGQSTAMTTNIVGSASQYGAYSGLNDFATSAKGFYAKQAENLTPAVEVPAGAKGYVHITSGVTITGGKNAIYGVGQTGGKNYYDPVNLSSTR